MGVTVILEVIGTGKGSIQKKFDELVIRIKKKLDAEETGSFFVNLNSFIANHETTLVVPTPIYNQGSRTTYTKRFNFLTLSEYPVSSFTVHDPAPTCTPQGTFIPSMKTTADVTIADSNFTGIIQTLVPTVYKQQKNLYVQVRGKRFTFSDFIIQTGIVYTGGDKPKSIILSIEHKPCLLGEMSNALLKEFAESLQLTKSEIEDGGFDDAEVNESEDGNFSVGLSFELSDFPVLQNEESPGKNFKYDVQRTILQYVDVLSRIRNRATVT